MTDATDKPGEKMPVIVGREVVYRGWLTFSILTLRAGDGPVFTRETVEHGRAAAVLPYDGARRVAMLVRQLRAPALLARGETSVLEAIAGMLDGDTPEQSARREAGEETGLALGKLEFVAEAWCSPGMTTERVSLFLAPYGVSDRVGTGGGLAAEHEDIEIVEMPLAELARMADAGRIDDMKTLVLVQTLRLTQPQLFSVP